MKLGIFDSGLGGLVVTKAIRDALPEHDIVYLGDTLHVPYGARSREAVADYTQRSVDWLFREMDCNLIIMACNTASAVVLRQLQQGYLKKNYPNRRILGVVVPTLETAIEKGYQRIGMIATARVVESGIYKDEIEKLGQGAQLFQKAAPLLVPAIEYREESWVEPLLEAYLESLLQESIECLILGCTHYGFVKQHIRKVIGPDIELLSQEEIIPAKLIDYLRRHPEIDGPVKKQGLTDLYVTDVTDSYKENADAIWECPVDVKRAII